MSEAAALRAVLAAEHAAAYAWSLAASRLRRRERADALSAWETHRARRDAVAALLRDRGEAAPAAEPAYALPFPVRSAGAARRLGLVVEQRCAAVYADLVAAGAGDARTLGAAALTDAAVRAALLRGAPVPWPGLPSSG